MDVPPDVLELKLIAHLVQGVVQVTEGIVVLPLVSHVIPGTGGVAEHVHGGVAVCEEVEHGNPLE